MSTYSDRIALLIDAKTGGAVSEMRKVSKEAKGLGDEADRSRSKFDKLGAQFGVTGAALKTGIGVAAVAAGGALVRFGADAIQSASALQEQLSATGTTFGSASKQVVDFSKTTAEGLGLSAREALTAANNFGAFFTNVGIAEDTSAELSTGLVALSSDLASFKDVAGGAAEVAEALRSGLSGEAEPLRRLDVFIDEASTKAKAMELNLGGAHRELTAGEKIIARYAQILEQTGNAQGDFARTSDSLANQQRVLAAQTEDLKAAFGQSSAPVFAGFVAGLNDILRSTTNLAQSVGGLERVQMAAGRAMTGAWLGPINIGRKFIQGLREDTEKASNKTEAFEQAVRRYAAIAGDADAETGALAAAQKDLQVAAAAATAEQESLASALVTEEDKAKEAAAALDKLKSSTMAVFDATRSYEQAQRAVSSAQLNVIAKQADLNALLKEGAVDAKAVAAAQRQVEKANKALASAQERVIEAQERIAKLEAGPSEQDKEQRSIDLAEARLDVADAEQDLAETREDGEATAIDLERAELRLREAKLNLLRTEEQQDTQTAELADARRDLASAEETVREAQQRVADEYGALLEAQRGDEDWTRKVWAAKVDLIAAQDGVRTAQESAAEKAIKLNEVLYTQAVIVGANSDAVGRLRENLMLLQQQYPQLAPILAAMLGMPAVVGAPMPGQVNGSLGPGGPGRRAAGGPVAASTPYIVGEQGPELFVPAGSGSIVPNHALRSGGGVNVTIHMPPGSDGDDVVRAIRRWELNNGPLY